MSNGLLFLGGLLVAILAALFAVPNFIDWNSYRGVFEEEASKVLGRDVRVGGSVNLKILPVPYVRFEKIRIASVTGQTGEPFVRADSFTMWLSAPSLLRGVLEASQIELEKPVLTLSVDDKGVGNWTQLELKPGELPFVPQDVALRSVRITDGAISVYNAGSERIAAVDGIDGIFSADGLKGPFRYSGAASWGGTSHDVKLATDVPASDGAFAVKVAARGDQSPSAFLLDGRVYNLSEKATFKGRWSGKVQAPGSAAASSGEKTPPPLIDIISDVTADPDGAKFENLTLTLDNAAAPQMISGSAVAAWSSSPRLDVVLNSKWLDIDWLAGAGDGSAGFAKLEQLAVGLLQSVAGDSAASAKIDLEQVKIGGENAGGLSIDADRQGNVTHLKTVKVSLPGGSRLDLAGELKNKAGKFSFTGNGFIGGTSFSRLKAWADKSGIPIDVNADGPYSAAGKLEIDDKRFFLTEASGDISGRPLAGELKITHDDRERTELMLQAADLDTREVFPGVASALHAEFRKALGLAPAKDGADAKAALPGDIRLRIIAGRLTDGEDSYRDVDALFAIDGQKLSLPVAKATTQSGLVIGLDGSIDSSGKGPVGTVAFDLSGAGPEAMQDLVRKAGLLDVLGDDAFRNLKDGKMAGLIHLGQRAPNAADITFDGLVNGSRLNGGAEFDGGLNDWRTRPSRLQATLDAASLPELLVALGRDGRVSQNPARAASASLISSGTFASGAQTRIDISSQNFGMSFAGRAQWPENSKLALDGTVDVKAGQADEALALAGLTLPAGADTIPVHGSLDVRRDKGLWTVASRGFSVGASAVSGRLTASIDPGATRIDGDIQTERVALPGLLAAVTDAAPAAPPQPVKANVPAGQIVPDVRAVWPEGLFNFDVLGNTNATLKIAFKSLVAGGGLATRDGSMTMALTPGKLTIGDLAADAAGGRLTGHASFEKASNGVALAAAATLDQAKLASISARGDGTGTFDLKAEARAQSPAGLVAVMTGSGTAKFKGAEVPGPSPSSISEVVDDMLGGKIQNDARAIGDALVASVGESAMPLGDRELAISIADGSLKLGEIALDNPEGALEGTVTADLATLGMNASFQLTPVLESVPPPVAPPSNRTPPAPKGPLPPALVLYSGQLDNLAALSVTADVGNLQRELVVRQMERNVEELEQTRRADEERVRLEKERKKKEAAARAAAQQKSMQPLPPVIPESAGTSNSPSGMNGAAGGGNPDDFFGTQQPAAAPDAQTSTGVTIVPEPQSATKPADAAANSEQNAAGQPLVIDPVTGLAVAKPQSTVKPAVAKSQLPPKPRTSSDEVMRALGGFQ